MVLKRYDMICSYTGSHMQEKEDGDWVDADEAEAKIEQLTSNLEYAAARFETQVAYTKEIENQLRAPFGAAQVRGLQHWLGVTGSVMEDESWEKLDEKTRRLYVLEVVKLAAE